jgi:hypothetical protein
MAQDRDRVELDIRSLAQRTCAVDRSVPNGSSIAFLLEHRGVSVLLGADVFQHQQCNVQSPGR